MLLRTFLIGVLGSLVVATPPALAEVHVTSPGDSGVGSLRDAIAGAGPGETVVIDPGVDPTIAPTEIQIDKDLVIRGQGSDLTTIRVEGWTRAFNVGSDVAGISVTIESLAITGARSRSGEIVSNGFPGLPGDDGGAIFNEADHLALVDVILEGNTTGDGSPGGTYPNYEGPPGVGGRGGNGGAIANVGTMTISDSALIANGAGEGNRPGFGEDTVALGGVGGGGGAIYNGGTLTVFDSTFVANEGGTGGDGGFADLGLTSPGGAGGDGGAIYNAGILTVHDSTFAWNAAGRGGVGGGLNGTGAVGGYGGAVFSEGGITRLSNVTIYGNVAGDGGRGGGESHTVVYGGDGGDGGEAGAVAGSADSTVSLAAATVAENEAGLGGPGMGAIPGAPGTDGTVASLGGATAMQVRGSIVISSIPSTNCGAWVLSLAGNVVYPSTGGCAGFLVGNPLLETGGLFANGGPTPTIALYDGSAALDAVDPADCIDALGDPLLFDQRGEPRPVGVACDAGAYEGSKPWPPSGVWPGVVPASSSLGVVDTHVVGPPKRRVRARDRRAHAVIRFTSTPPGAHFQCRLDGREFKPCRSPKAYSLALGRYRFVVRAVFGGVVDPSPAKVTLMVFRRDQHPGERDRG